MVRGGGDLGSRKHGKSGTPGRSPKYRHALKREAEKQVRVDKTRIKDPKQSVQELFKRNGRS
jgi:hypothetical protein